MSVESLDLRHQLDDLKSIVWLFGERIAEQVELFEVLEVKQKLEEFVKISQFIVADQEDIQELVLCEASNVC